MRWTTSYTSKAVRLMSNVHFQDLGMGASSSRVFVECFHEVRASNTTSAVWFRPTSVYDCKDISFPVAAGIRLVVTTHIELRASSAKPAVSIQCTLRLTCASRLGPNHGCFIVGVSGQKRTDADLPTCTGINRITDHLARRGQSLVRGQ